MIPQENRKKNEVYQLTTSGYSLNMVLPDSRLQEGAFQIQANLGDIVEEDNNLRDKTIGLAALSCMRTYAALKK